MSKNKPPSLYPIELVWETAFGRVSLWARKNMIPSDVYKLAWETDGLVIRSIDVVFQDTVNMYDAYWDMVYAWAGSRSRTADVVRQQLSEQITAISRKACTKTPSHRFTVVPLRWLGHMAKFLMKERPIMRFGGPSGRLVDTQQMCRAIDAWASCFSSPMITVRLRNKTQESADQATTLMNTGVVLPERNLTDMLMAPQERTMFPIQGAGVFHFFFTFRAPRTRLYAACALLNPMLKNKQAQLVLPDVWTGGHGNSILLTVEAPFLCNGFPLVNDGEYPNAASHDMAYEAVRNAEQLAQKVYAQLAANLESYDVEENESMRQVALEG